LTFAERLTELRIENGYSTRVAFAEKIGVPVTTLKHYEDGDREPGHSFLKKVSELFNVSIDYLLCLTDDKEVLHSFRVSTKEQDMIGKYRGLDCYGSDLVDVVIDKEYARCTEVVESSKVVELTLDRGSGQLVARNGRDLSQDDKEEILSITRRWKEKHQQQN